MIHIGEEAARRIIEDDPCGLNDLAPESFREQIQVLVM